MKIALAGVRFRNGDIDFNMQQIRRFMQGAARQGAQLVCFGEAFLQGFDAFSWTYENDRDIAVSLQDEVFARLLSFTEEFGIDLLLGFLEREGDKLYSSCVLLGDGKMYAHYRRISIGWKEYTLTDNHYCEGDAVETFDYRGRKCAIALCGDLWDTTATMFKQDQEVLFWPVYINFSSEEWYGSANERQAYADKAAEFGGNVLMINCVDETDASETPALGGCFWFRDGGIEAEWPLGSEGMLTIDI